VREVEERALRKCASAAKTLAAIMPMKGRDSFKRTSHWVMEIEDEEW
jgi:hypothetical protein